MTPRPEKKKPSPKKAAPKRKRKNWAEKLMDQRARMDPEDLDDGTTFADVRQK